MEIALYRKYRPTKFSEVRGQEHVIKVLESVVKSGNVSHAYLFSGSRGTGKTSIARIFAREIGCKEEDLYEIDAASNRGIDDIRALREAVKVLPFSSPYKVYIVDEVHMLTKEAFNALLKTLEEPPKHAVFILATTETHKLPETIISRCQSFVFKKPSQEILKKLIQDVSKKEGYNMKAASADLIALLGDGSFRDTLGVLQKVLLTCESKKKDVDHGEVERMLGAPRPTLVNDFISALAEKNAGKALALIQDVSKENIDIGLFTTLTLQKTRAILLVKLAPELEKEISADYTGEDMSFVKNFSIPRDPKLSLVLTELLSASSEISRSFIPELPLEIAVLRLCGEEVSEGLRDGEK